MGLAGEVLVGGGGGDTVEGAVVVMMGEVDKSERKEGAQKESLQNKKAKAQKI